MSEQNKSETPPESVAKKAYYKSPIHGLSVSLSESDERDEVGVDEVRFEAYSVRKESTGEVVKFGLLETEDPFVMDILEKDYRVEKLTKKQYTELLDEATKVIH